MKNEGLIPVFCQEIIFLKLEYRVRVLTFKHIIRYIDQI